ncbi:uncharacterized protein A4U43_C05F13250 [Asparagus officinalis]|uniref:RRM domain-containing protein n=1 Tax=Asparagus officinalis TaxID=4686 RepID=A0A5P1EV20_ASPOF|nr:uncharacterized protein A4U43_C05F13250 [Asparagus officinalis]
MEADDEMAAADVDDQDPQSSKERLKEIEEEAGALREMHAKVEKEMSAVQVSYWKIMFAPWFNISLCFHSSSGAASQAEKEEVDSRSIYVDKFGQPKGFAYVEFVEVEAVQNALPLNESELHGRQLKVSAKRTNVPGMKQYRGRRASPYMGFRSRRPYMPPPFYAPFAYGYTVLLRCHLYNTRGCPMLVI